MDALLARTVCNLDLNFGMTWEKRGLVQPSIDQISRVLAQPNPTRRQSKTTTKGQTDSLWPDPDIAMYIAVLASLAPVVSAIWPVPITYSEGNTTVVLAGGFTIEFNGPNGTIPGGCVDTSSKVWAAIDRTYVLLDDGFVPDMLYQFEQDFEPTANEMAEAQVIKKLVITQRYLFL
jgi:hypothetical protein